MRSNLTPEICCQLRLIPEVSMPLIAILIQKAELRLGTQMSVDCLCSANALLDNLSHGGLRMFVHLLMRRMLLQLFDDESCLHVLIREVNASTPEGMSSLLEPWVSQLEAEEMAAEGETQQALAHLKTCKADVWPYQVPLIPSVVIHSAWHDHALLEGLLHYRMGEFDAALNCFQGLAFSACFPQGLDMHRKAVIQAIARLIRLEYPTELCSQIIKRLTQAVPVSNDPRILLHLFVHDLECTVFRLSGNQDCYTWWRKLEEMPTTRCSLFLKHLASAKRSIMLRRSWQKPTLDESAFGTDTARICQDLAAIRSSFEASPWLGPMLVL